MVFEEYKRVYSIIILMLFLGINIKINKFSDLKEKHNSTFKNDIL